jgi:hypothetical protein
VNHRAGTARSTLTDDENLWVIGITKVDKRQDAASTFDDKKTGGLLRSRRFVENNREVI